MLFNPRVLFVLIVFVSSLLLLYFVECGPPQHPVGSLYNNEDHFEDRYPFIDVVWAWIQRQNYNVVIPRVK
jgi:hypothetical protein